MRFPFVIKTMQQYTNELAGEFSSGYEIGNNDGYQSGYYSGVADENERLKDNHADWLSSVIDNLSLATGDYRDKAQNAFLTSAQYIFGKGDNGRSTSTWTE